MRAAFATLRADQDLKAVVALALPAIGTSLLQTMVFLVDRLMLGHHSEDALAAMQTAGPVIWTVFSVFSAFTVGTLAVVGRAIGAKDPLAATSAARGSLVVAIVGGLVVGVGSWALVSPMVSLLGSGSDPAVQTVASDYLRIGLPAMPFFFIGITCISVLQAAGDTRTPLLIGLATNVVNIIGNSILVFGTLGAPRLGAVGSAWSSVGAAVLEAVLGLYCLLRAKSPVSLRFSAGIDGRAGALRVLRVAWGSWGEKIIYHAAYLTFVRFVIGLGPVAMAANQALISIESVSFLTADGCAVAAGAIVAQRLGARDPARARAAGWMSVGLCASILGVWALVFVSIPHLLVGAFRDDPAIIHAGVNALRVGAIAQLPMAVATVLSQSIRGAGATREALVVSLVGAAFVRLIATYFYVRVMHLGLTGVWLGSTSDWIVRAVVYAWRWKRGSWERITI